MVNEIDDFFYFKSKPIKMEQKINENRTHQTEGTSADLRASTNLAFVAN